MGGIFFIFRIHCKQIVQLRDDGRLNVLVTP